MEVAKITSKGQITIPISIRRQLELNEGDKVLFIYKPDGVLMVNPTTFNGATDGDVVDVAESEMASEAVAAMKERQSAKSKPKPIVSEPAREPIPETAAVYDTTLPQDEPVQISRPIPPPGDDPPPKPETHIGGLNLGTLLDDIRSIGSNI